MRRRFLALVLAGVATLAAGCGGGSAPAAARPLALTPPHLHAFLQLPVATPSACPKNANGTTVGRIPPWIAHVDVSVFLTRGVTPGEIAALRSQLRRAPLVAKTYFETRAEAYREFQRLYTCWARVGRHQTPPSLRVVLVSTATIQERNVLVTHLLHEPGVASISCDPTSPCVDVVRSAQAGRG